MKTPERPTLVFEKHIRAGMVGGRQALQSEHEAVVRLEQGPRLPVSIQVMTEKILAHEMDPEAALALIAACGIATED